jgi:hypothetical protein
MVGVTQSRCHQLAVNLLTNRTSKNRADSDLNSNYFNLTLEPQDFWMMVSGKHIRMAISKRHETTAR